MPVRQGPRPVMRPVIDRQLQENRIHAVGDHAHLFLPQAENLGGLHPGVAAGHRHGVRAADAHGYGDEAGLAEQDGDPGERPWSNRGRRGKAGIPDSGWYRRTCACPEAGANRLASSPLAWMTVCRDEETRAALKKNRMPLRKRSGELMSGLKAKKPVQCTSYSGAAMGGNLFARRLAVHHATFRPCRAISVASICTDFCAASGIAGPGRIIAGHDDVVHRASIR